MVAEAGAAGVAGGIVCKLSLRAFCRFSTSCTRSDAVGKPASVAVRVTASLAGGTAGGDFAAVIMSGGAGFAGGTAGGDFTAVASIGAGFAGRLNCCQNCL